MTDISTFLLPWYRKYGRHDLPWQKAFVAAVAPLLLLILFVFLMAMLLGMGLLIWRLA